MFGYVVRRLVAGLLVLVTAILLTFLFFYSGPADPARAICGDRCVPERLTEIRASLNLDVPKTQQITDFYQGIVVGRDVPQGSLVRDCEAPCLGFSFSTEDPVKDMILAAMPVTISVAIGASLIALVVGTGMGIAASLRRGTAVDKGIVGGSLLMSAIPYYIVALFAYLYLAAEWQLFNRGGYVPLTESPTGWFNGLLLAWIVLGLYSSTQYSRYSRGSMLEVLGEDYMRTAKAKGLKSRRITVRHGLRAAMAPIVTIYGLDLAALLAGTIFTEFIFDLRGIGLMALQAVSTQDLPVLVGTVLFTAFVIVIMNIVTDIVYSFIDPRVRLS